MATAIKSAFFKLRQKSVDKGEFSTVPIGKLFPSTSPLVDGDDCLHDCESCVVKYPAKFSIDEDDKLYGFVKGWSTHLLVATGKTDWVRDVADEKGSVMEAVGKHGQQLANGKLMLSASNMPPPSSYHTHDGDDHDTRGTTVLVLPAFTYVDNVTPKSVPTLLDSFVASIPSNTSPLDHHMRLPASSDLVFRDCPHHHLILLCSQKTRDARCGQSAPLLRKEFERHLRPLGLYRDLTDERPGGVGIYFISHVGGHKYSANCMIYRRAGTLGAGSPPSPPEVLGDAETLTQNGHANGTGQENGHDGAGSEESGPAHLEAAQCIWLARVRPEDCENIVRYTILQGKVVKPDRQLRGGFDRAKGLTSW